MQRKTFSGNYSMSQLQKELIAAIGYQDTTGWYLEGFQGEVTFVATKETCPDPTAYIEAHISGGGKNTRMEKWEKIKELREKRILDSGVLVDGYWFHSDQAFRDVITQGLRLLTIDQLPDEDPRKMAVIDDLIELRESRWKTMDNQFVEPELILAIKIDAAHGVLTKRCHFNGERLKAIVNASDTPEKVELHAGWPTAYYDVPHTD